MVFGDIRFFKDFFLPFAAVSDMIASGEFGTILTEPRHAGKKQN